MKVNLPMRYLQQGVALVMSLLILVLVTLLALSLMSTSIFEERMAGNARDRTLAFESAEYALREAQDVLSSPVLPAFSSSGGSTNAYFIDLNTSPGGEKEEVYWRDTHNWGTNAVATSDTNGILTGQVQPRYVIEEYPAIPCQGDSLKWPPPPPRSVFRITARGQGMTAEAVVILQSWYDRGC
jgi:type IV pilus assembly protein PilX